MKLKPTETIEIYNFFPDIENALEQAGFTGQAINDWRCEQMDMHNANNGAIFRVWLDEEDPIDIALTELLDAGEFYMRVSW